MPKRKTGRPTVVNKDVLAKLKFAFMAGLNDEEACYYAGISTTTLYRYQEEHEDFGSNKEHWKDNVRVQARINIAKQISNKKDVQTSKWYLERKDPEFCNKNETTLSGNVNMANPYADLTTDDLKKLIDDD